MTASIFCHRCKLRLEPEPEPTHFPPFLAAVIATLREHGFETAEATASANLFTGHDFQEFGKLGPLPGREWTITIKALEN